MIPTSDPDYQTVAETLIADQTQCVSEARMGILGTHFTITEAKLHRVEGGISFQESSLGKRPGNPQKENIQLIVFTKTG
jgi:hypothetical protein